MRPGGLPWRRLLLAASLVLLVVVVWAARHEVRDAGAVLRGLPLWALGAALVLEAGAVAALPQVYRAAVAALGGDVGYRDGLQISMGAFTLSRVLPGGGAAGAAWAAARMRDAGVSGVRAWTAVALEGVLAMATLGGLVLAGTTAALYRGRVGLASVLVVLAVTLGLFGAGWACVALLRSSSLRTRAFDAARRRLPAGAGDRLGSWQHAMDDAAASLPPADRLMPIVAWSAVNWLLDIGALWVVFAGLGAHVELGVLLVGFGVANLVTALPHTPGGLGLVEAGMTGAFVALGATAAVALAAVLAYRAISYWLPVLAGVPQYLRPQRPHAMLVAMRDQA